MKIKKIITIAILLAGYSVMQAEWNPDESAAAFVADPQSTVYHAGTVRRPSLTARPGLLLTPRQDPLASNRAISRSAPAASEVVRDVPQSWLAHVPESLLD